jgi:hypothetical protein
VNPQFGKDLMRFQPFPLENTMQKFGRLFLEKEVNAAFRVENF